MAHQPSPLLNLPPEIRNKIWTFAFGNLDTIPLESSLTAPYQRSAYDETCHGCSHSSTNPHSMTVALTLENLLTCRQIYAEAQVFYRSTLTVHASLTSELQLTRSHDPCVQQYLRHLRLRVHIGVSRDADIQEDMRHIWLDRLTNLAERFPALKTLHVTAHLRPPIAYENLVDAIYLAGPLSHLPPRIQLTLNLNYISEDVMIDHPELGRVWYSDALEEHRMVIEDCMGDEIFREGFRSSGRGVDLEVMTARLLQISQEHEQPWLLRLKRRKAERDRAEAAENRRMNGAR
jgi:hypothetical protein